MTLQEKLDNLPAKPGCYLFKDASNKTLYVGKAAVLKSRVRSYFQKSRNLDARLELMVGKVKDLEFYVTDTESEALILENNLIKDRKPRYNIDLKDDKSYPYIRITKEDFPQVFVTRKIIRDGSEYYGPYTDVKNLRTTLKTLQRIFYIRSCRYDLNNEVIARKSVPLCLDYYIGKCKGPCQGLFSKEEYAMVIEKARRFLRGKTDDIVRELKQEMDAQSARLEFEEAARTRDKLQTLENYRNNQKMVHSDERDRDVWALKKEDDDACVVLFKIRDGKILGRIHKYVRKAEWFSEGQLLQSLVRDYYLEAEDIPQDVLLQTEFEESATISNILAKRSGHKVYFSVPQIGEKKKLVDLCRKNAGYLLEELKLQRIKARDYVPHTLQALQRDLRLPKPPRHMECFDISNIQGSDPVASMVCFVDGKPRKSEYRRFNIKRKNTPDDFAMMREAVERRYSRLLREEKPLPDLIVIDGGKGQLSSAWSVLQKLGLKDQPVIGLAKRLEEIFFPNVMDAQMLPRSSSSLRLVQQIRDEAHRFAVKGHRQRRSSRTLVSQLDNIEGIGAARRNKLLKEFGSIREISKLTIRELTERGRLPGRVAQNVYEHFRKINEKP